MHRRVSYAGVEELICLPTARHISAKICDNLEFLFEQCTSIDSVSHSINDKMVLQKKKQIHILTICKSFLLSFLERIARIFLWYFEFIIQNLLQIKSSTSRWFNIKAYEHDTSKASSKSSHLFELITNKLLCSPTRVTWHKCDDLTCGHNDDSVQNVYLWSSRSLIKQ